MKHNLEIDPAYFKEKKVSIVSKIGEWLTNTKKFLYLSFYVTLAQKLIFYYLGIMLPNLFCSNYLNGWCQCLKCQDFDAWFEVGITVCHIGNTNCAKWWCKFFKVKTHLIQRSNRESRSVWPELAKFSNPGIFHGLLTIWQNLKPILA